MMTGVFLDLYRLHLGTVVGKSCSHWQTRRIATMLVSMCTSKVSCDCMIASLMEQTLDTQKQRSFHPLAVQMMMKLDQARRCPRYHVGQLGRRSLSAELAMVAESHLLHSLLQQRIGLIWLLQFRRLECHTIWSLELQMTHSPNQGFSRISNKCSETSRNH